MSTYVRRWIIWTIAIPLVVAGLGIAADQLEQRRGHDSKAARGVRGVRKVVRTVA